MAGNGKGKKSRSRLKLLPGGKSERSGGKKSSARRTEGPRGKDARILIRLPDLATTSPHLTPSVGLSFAEAATTCFEEFFHSSPAPMDVRVKTTLRKADIELLEMTRAMMATHADRDYAAEHGAYGIAILLAKILTGLSFIEQSAKGTGFDYWIGETDGVLFQKKVRLEVSGSRSGSELELRRRAKTKRLQTTQSDHLGVPALVIVVDFKLSSAMFEERK